MANLIMCQKTRACDARGEDAIHEFGVPRVRFEDLPMDVVYRIMSKLPPKEFARASVLSSKLRCTWSVCPRLTFDGVQVCKCHRNDLRLHTGRFIHEVNAVLEKHHGKVVETLEIRMDLVDSHLVHHINNWVNFAASSGTKNLTLDLKPINFAFRPQLDRYAFPFQFLSSGSISRLQHMQLSFVSLKPPSHHIGFPNLKKLHLQLVHASNKDLGDVLSHCCNLEWLYIDRCFLNDELVVNGTLSHLLYLSIDCCKFTKVEFHAMNLSTFEYYGRFIPIKLSRSLKIQNANIMFYIADFQDGLISLLNGLPNVENLTLRWLQLIKKQWLWDNPLKFSCLKHLQLFLSLRETNVDSILYSVSFLRATPFIEDLEVHFSGDESLWLADMGPRRQVIGQCNNPYNYLKKMCITGFKGARGQVEFLLHVVENAPALEAITVDTHKSGTSGGDRWMVKGGSPPFEEAKRIAMTCLSRAIPPSVKLDVI